MSEFVTQNINELDESPAGFSFDNIHRNTMIEQFAQKSSSNSSAAGYLPTATKTGTTIVGLVYKGGVVLGADTRATGGTEVADKNCEKIHYLTPNIYCCGAGTAADTEKTTELISSQLELLRMNTGGSQSRVVTACTMLKPCCTDIRDMFLLPWSWVDAMSTSLMCTRYTRTDPRPNCLSRRWDQAPLLQCQFLRQDGIKI